MDCNKEEAVRAKNLAESKMHDKDFIGAKKLILKAQQLHPEIENISQMLTVCEVHCSSQARVNGETDWYGILQVSATADELLIKKQYRKLALLLHPDKNKFAGAEAAFKLVGEAQMTLTDPQKRSTYDMKRSSNFRVAASRPPHQQQKRTAPVRTTNFNDESRQHPPSGTVRTDTFWTICPSCGMKYQYYLNILKKNLRCQTCLKPFVALDVNQKSVPAAAAASNARKSSGVSTQKPPNPQASASNARPQTQSFNGVNSRNLGAEKDNEGYTTGVKFKKVNLNTETGADAMVQETAKVSTKSAKPATTVKIKRGKKRVVQSSDESSDSDDDVIVEDEPPENVDKTTCQFVRRSSRQRQNVSYNEDKGGDRDDEYDDDDLTDATRWRRLRKDGSSGHSDVKTMPDDETADVSTGASTSGNDKKQNGPSGEEKQQNVTERIDIDDDSSQDVSEEEISDTGNEKEQISYPDPEFFDFEKYRAENLFKVNQIWALYDNQDGMPRFYARIKSVKSGTFSLRYTWLEYAPTDEADKAWYEKELPVACGKFVLGTMETADSTQMFSHMVTCKQGKKRDSYEIFPNQDEIWALFKGWDLSWVEDSDVAERQYKYEIIEVLTDFTVEAGILVVPLVKIKGFVSLFIRSKDKPPYVIPSGEMLRFSHRVPSHRMSGDERDGIPEGAVELDPASLPVNLEEAFDAFVPEKMTAEDVECGEPIVPQACNDNNVNSSATKPDNNDNNVNSSATKPDNTEGENNIQATTNSDGDGATECEGIPCQEPGQSYEYPRPEFFRFEETRIIEKFKAGQIWAMYCGMDQLPKFYCYIKSIDLESSKLEIKWVDCCPQGKEDGQWSQNGLPSGCGLFKVTGEEQTFNGTNVFSHPIQARRVKGNVYEIYPRTGEVWAVYRNWKIGWSEQDVCECKYDYVEILNRSSTSIEAIPLTKVDGHVAVFMPGNTDQSIQMLDIPLSEYLRFSHQVPAFRLSDQRGGVLRGYWELDAAALSPLVFHA